MRTLDFTPLYRSTIGFDRLAGLLDSFAASETQSAYPPYNIERVDENNYAITMAVAGFTADEIAISTKQGNLLISGEKGDQNKDDSVETLHQGIANRSFERRFHLADHVEVLDASLDHGLLRIELKRELPEAMKPRKIAINATGTAAKQINSTAA